MAYHNNRMGYTRRTAVFTLIAPALLTGNDQDPQQQDRNLPLPPNPEEDQKLPNGKSQKDAIAKEQHEQALKDASDLIAVAEQLKADLQKAGNYVVPVACVKKTEEIERLARRIRGRLKD